MKYVTSSPLGKKSAYISQYQPDLLFPIPRKIKRDEINVPELLPFKGADIWNGFEISWLNNKGKPVVALGEFIFPCTSPNIIESKSFKLYLNSFNNTHIDSLAMARDRMARDLSQNAGSEVKVNLVEISEFANNPLDIFSGINLDKQDITCDNYTVASNCLIIEDEKISESLYSNLLKSNCLVTGQPDWGSVFIEYSGNKINHEGLLKYIVSFRNHNEFHEQCVERIFMDILTRCAPEKLSVYARYTRRGGLDINPYRSTESDFIPKNNRLCRQ